MSATNSCCIARFPCDSTAFLFSNSVTTTASYFDGNMLQEKKMTKVEIRSVKTAEDDFIREVGMKSREEVLGFKKVMIL